MSYADMPIFAGGGRLNDPADPSRALSYLTSIPNHPVGNADLAVIVDRCWQRCELLRIRFRMALGQACLETGDFLFGNQVSPDQHNIGGIGATNDGAAGTSNPNWRVGVDIFFAHLCAWTNQDAAALIGAVSPRLDDVRSVAKTKGYAETWRDLGGRWAVANNIPWQDQATMAGNYGSKIEARAVTIFGSAPQEPSAMRVQVTAGHHNTSGGNGEETITTGIMTPLILEELRKRGVDADTVTPNGGRGMYPGSLTAVALEVVRRANAQGMFQIFLEDHTEGVDDESVAGVFAIYPDDPTGRTDDLDTDVRDILGPMVTRRIAQRTGMGIRGNGLMSERRTSVGNDGDRLGIFKATEGIRGACTRLIIEMGAHTNPADFKRHRDPAWQRNCAIAIAESFVAFMSGTPLPPLDAPPPNIVIDEEPQGGGPTDQPNLFHLPNGQQFYVIGPFYALYLSEPHAMRYWGYPRTGMFLDREQASPYHGQLVQYFDRCVMHCAEVTTDPDAVELGLLGYNEALGRGLIAP